MIDSISSAHDGRSSISPATCPDDISPRSVRPSTMAARSSTGVFAAISTCPQLSPPSRRMTRPCRSISRHPIPDTPRNAAAFRADRTSAPARRGPLASPAPARPRPSRWSTIVVRSTRCGTPSTRRVTTVPSRPAAR